MVEEQNGESAIQISEICLKQKIVGETNESAKCSLLGRI